MARFNLASANPRQTTNFENAPSYRLSPELELYSACCTSLLQDTFYESSDDRLTRIQGLVTVLAKTHPRFIGQLAVYCREQMYLRSIPLVLAVELAKHHHGDDLVRKVTRRVINRVDEITEILAYYQLSNHRTGTKKLNKLSKQLRLGIGDAFNKFDEYQFSKYSRKQEIKLRDALFIVHPKPKDANQQIIFDKIAKDTLTPADTWESRKTQAGQLADDEEDKVTDREVWEGLIDDKKMGYMATLRNLRNILQAGISKDHINKVIDYLTNPTAVKNSKQLCFRWYSAYKELETIPSPHTAKVLEALDKAMQLSSVNLEGYDDDTAVLVAVDMSGSMWATLSNNSTVSRQDVGLVLGSVMRHKCENAAIGLFGSEYTCRYLPKGSILTTVQHLKTYKVGGATNGYLAIDHLNQHQLRTDKVFMFTDMQLWNTNERQTNLFTSGSLSRAWNQYKQSEAGKDSHLYLFDLAGYGTSPIDQVRNDVTLIAGFSDAIFNVLSHLDRGEDGLKDIRSIIL